MDFNMLVKAIVYLKETLEAVMQTVLENSEAILANSEIILTLKNAIGSLAGMTFNLFKELNSILELVIGIVAENTQMIEALTVAVSQLEAKVEFLQTLVYSSAGISVLNFILIIILFFLVRRKKKPCKKNKRYKGKKK